jgi:hypothetical protein
MPTKKSRAEYMRAYRKAKPQKRLKSEGRDLREAWAVGLEDLAERGTPIYVRYDGHQLTADFPGAFAHALAILSGYREIVPDTGLAWMYDLLVIGVFGPGETVKLTLGQANGRGANYSKGGYQTRPHGAKVAAKLGLSPKGPVPPLPSLDELRKLIFGGIVITEEDWERAKKIHDLVKYRYKGENRTLKGTKSQVSAYFDNQKFSSEKYLDWKNLQQQKAVYGRRIMPKKTI